MPSDLIQMAGASPAGRAAITLAMARRRLLVHELHHEVGDRLGGDFQGLENWSGQRNVLDWLLEFGVTRKFAAPPRTKCSNPKRNGSARLQMPRRDLCVDQVFPPQGMT